VKKNWREEMESRESKLFFVHLEGERKSRGESRRNEKRCPSNESRAHPPLLLESTEVKVAVAVAVAVGLNHRTRRV